MVTRDPTTVQSIPRLSIQLIKSLHLRVKTLLSSRSTRKLPGPPLWGVWVASLGVGANTY